MLLFAYFASPPLITRITDISRFLLPSILWAVRAVSNPGTYVSNTVYPEILAGIKFGGWALNRHRKNIGGFKFGGSVRDRHTYICKYEILADFNLAVAS